MKTNNTSTQERTKGFYIKKLIFQAIAIAIGIAFAVSQQDFSSMTIFAGLCFAGVPSGWQIMTNIFGYGLNLYTLALKFILSLLIGMIAFPVMLIRNIVGLIIAIKKENKAEVVDAQ